MHARNSTLRGKTHEPRNRSGAPAITSGNALAQPPFNQPSTTFNQPVHTPPYNPPLVVEGHRMVEAIRPPTPEGSLFGRWLQG